MRVNDQRELKAWMKGGAGLRTSTHHRKVRHEEDRLKNR
jgi:hypothetical protein